MAAFQDSLRGYGRPIFERDKFICAYCGRDHSAFDLWIFLTVDHLLPKDDRRREEVEWKVTACSFCNTAKNRACYPVTDKTKPSDIIEAKRKNITKTIQAYRTFWEEHYGLR